MALKLRNTNVLPETVYTRNLAGENLFEFRFDKETRELYEITVVAIQQDTVQSVVVETNINTKLYECFLADASKLEISEPIKVLRSDKSLQFFWGNQMTNSFTISKECILGVDDSDNLCALILTNLKKEVIYEIVGF